MSLWSIAHNSLRLRAVGVDLIGPAPPVAQLAKATVYWHGSRANAQVPLTGVNDVSAGRFLNRVLSDGGIRSMWVQVKVVF